MRDAHHSRRVAAVALLLVAVVALAAFRPLHEAIVRWSARGAVVIAARGALGPAVFIVLSALSAMLAFFSTAVLIPFAVAAWGKVATVALLWTGWFAGGVTSYAIGRFFGRAAVVRFMSAEKLDRYSNEARHLVGFPELVLLQLALPSEIPGYVTGMLRFRARSYFAALAIAELPFAVGAVLLGDSFLRGNVAMMIAAGVAGLLLTSVAAMMLRRRRRFATHADGGRTSLPAGDRAA